MSVAHVLLQHINTGITAAVEMHVAGIDVHQVRRTSTQIVSQEFPTLHGNTTLILAIIKPPGPDIQVNNPTYLSTRAYQYQLKSALQRAIGLKVFQSCLR